MWITSVLILFLKIRYIVFLFSFVYFVHPVISGELFHAYNILKTCIIAITKKEPVSPSGELVPLLNHFIFIFAFSFRLRRFFLRKFF